MPAPRRRGCPRGPPPQPATVMSCSTMAHRQWGGMDARTAKGSATADKTRGAEVPWEPAPATMNIRPDGTTNGLISLVVLLGAGSVARRWAPADPMVGLVVTAAMLLVLRRAARHRPSRPGACLSPGRT